MVILWCEFKLSDKLFKYLSLLKQVKQIQTQKLRSSGSSSLGIRSDLLLSVEYFYNYYY